MERFLTFEQKEFYTSIYSIYIDIVKSAESMSMLHVSTIGKNNKFHFEHFLQTSNKQISKLKGLLPEYDKRADELKYLLKDNLIKKAEKFFATDLY